MSGYPYPRPSPSEMDVQMVRLGFMTEEDRIKAAYRRILVRQIKRKPKP